MGVGKQSLVKETRKEMFSMLVGRECTEVWGRSRGQKGVCNTLPRTASCWRRQPARRSTHHLGPSHAAQLTYQLYPEEPQPIAVLKRSEGQASVGLLESLLDCSCYQTLGSLPVQVSGH